MHFDRFNAIQPSQLTMSTKIFFAKHKQTNLKADLLFN